MNLTRTRSDDPIMSPMDLIPKWGKEPEPPREVTPEETSANVIALFDRATHRNG